MVIIRAAEFGLLTAQERQDATALAEGQIYRLQAGQEFTCAFTLRGTRRARITRIGRQQQRFFQSYSASTKTWTKERKLVARDLMQTSCPR